MVLHTRKYVGNCDQDTFYLVQYGPDMNILYYCTYSTTQNVLGEFIIQVKLALLKFYLTYCKVLKLSQILPYLNPYPNRKPSLQKMFSYLKLYPYLKPYTTDFKTFSGPKTLSYLKFYLI